LSGTAWKIFLSFFLLTAQGLAKIIVYNGYIYNEQFTHFIDQYRKIAVHSSVNPLNKKLPSILGQIYAVLWILIGFNADPDSDPGSQTNTDPDLDPGQTLESQKVNFCMKNILKVRNRSKNILTNVQKLFKRQESWFICKFCYVFLLLDPDPDPGQPNECGSMRIRIYVRTI
jgi:hypothetical protein